VIRHSRGWIEAECKKNGLWMEVEDQLSAQTWLLIGRSKAPLLDTPDSTELE
jgi:hypothetical protein